MQLKLLDKSNFNEIKNLFRSVFMSPPWCDDWSDDEQLTEYLLDLMDVRTPLVYGLYDGDELVGASIGSVRHWFGGTEYHVEEFFIKTVRQHLGLGTEFFSLIENAVKEKRITNIFLMTEHDKPAFGFYKKQGFKEIEKLVSLMKEL